MNEIDGYEDENNLRVIKEGYLLKEGHLKKIWKKRWFVLSNTELVYFENEDKKKLKGVVPLDSCRVTPPKHSRKECYCFRLSSDKISGVGLYGKYPKYILAASSLEEMEAWITAINGGISGCERRLSPASSFPFQRQVSG
eukprot:TRINITY_DN15885_c0_g1::TRINITY_DN15885_c0_g1_i1::g.22495::m.22495 TRINITY_DN15885_c0_g1::TRINITY_DN15885_c0_g1_i1::g.22495  ORF type:complete len:140 (-),score=-4.45,sp/Q54KA7/SECG_DICDI/31.25/5e-13,PH/PF00169.24/1.9e-22,PH_11/PF15413.1/6.9e-06,PH_8/PF15409.1/7.1e-05,PH_8/PF15409.1/5e+02,PH_3/PF14593.1/3.1e-05,PH_9/PF15410.1/12,PH_9/PF15410.1/0.67,PH_4/PF15404.1/1,PH_4/PF15404.1/82,Mig-14/PF07395.6/1.2,Mig-14/PF07395.6/1e+02 TRINITY_DN15885_c0_g1_i1:369-788(-)